jgi:hypothetical protein
VLEELLRVNMLRGILVFVLNVIIYIYMHDEGREAT